MARHHPPPAPGRFTNTSPQDYLTTGGEPIRSGDVDLLARTKALAVIHKAYAVTGAVCLSAAALVEGTVVNEMLAAGAKAADRIRIGHPSGIAECFVKLVRGPQGQWDLLKAGVNSTARPIMEGQVYVSRTSFAMETPKLQPRRQP